MEVNKLAITITSKCSSGLNLLLVLACFQEENVPTFNNINVAELGNLFASRILI